MSKLNWIRNLQENELQTLLNSVATVLIDLDGVLIRQGELISGSPEAVMKLRKLGKKIGFVTNNSGFTSQAFAHFLAPFGAVPDEVVTPNTTLLQYLKEVNFKKDLFVVAPPCVKQLLKEAGYKVIDYKDIKPGELEGKISVALKELSKKALDLGKNVGIVYLDLDFNFTYGALQVAQVLLNHLDDVRLLSGTSDDKVPLDDTSFFISSRFFIEAMENWTDRKAIPMAKPGQALQNLIKTKFEVSDPDKVLMVGDNLSTDIAFGVQAGFKTCVVLTGDCKPSDIEQWDSLKKDKPDYVASNLAELCQI